MYWKIIYNFFYFQIEKSDTLKNKFRLCQNKTKHFQPIILVAGKNIKLDQYLNCMNFTDRVCSNVALGSHTIELITKVGRNITSLGQVGQ